MGQEYSGILRQELTASRKISGFHPKQIDMIKEKFVLMCDDDLGIDLVKFAKLVRMTEEDAKKVR